MCIRDSFTDCVSSRSCCAPKSPTRLAFRTAPYVDTATAAASFSQKKTKVFLRSARRATRAAEASADDEEPEIDENAATTAIPSLRATTTNAANLATATTPGKSILKTPSRSKTPGGRGDAPKTPKSAFGVYYRGGGTFEETRRTTMGGMGSPSRVNVKTPGGGAKTPGVTPGLSLIHI